MLDCILNHAATDRGATAFLVLLNGRLSLCGMGVARKVLVARWGGQVCRSRGLWLVGSAVAEGLWLGW